MGRNKSQVLIVLGILLIALGILLEMFNLYYSSRALKSVNQIIEQMDELEEQELQVNEIPDYLLNPKMDMPEQEIDGQRYIGKLTIPGYGLDLPIISQWSYPNLKVAPCRYQGSAYQNNLIIAAHNYDSHFGKLKNIPINEEVLFTDIDGNIFRYQVAEKEVLKDTAIDEMKAGEWDLTLFTCTVGGANRMTIRCQQIAEI